MLSYKKAEKEYLPQLIEICSTCFDEDVDEVVPVFNEYINTDMCYVAIEDEKVIANIFLVPCTLNESNSKTVQGHYVYGAATLPQYRGKGIMHSLIEFALKNAESCGDSFSALLPANDNLYDFYSGLNYKEMFYASDITVKYDEIKEKILPKHNFDECSFDIMEQLRFNICKEYSNTVNWNKDVIKFAVHQAKTSLGGAVVCDKGYVIYYRENKNTVFATEFMCKQQDFEYMLCVLKARTTALNYHLRLPYWLCNNESKRFGMLRALQNYKPVIQKDSFPYLGLTFD